MKEVLENEVVWRVFWVQTPTALVMRREITPDEFNSVIYVETEYQSGYRKMEKVSDNKLKN